MSANSSRNLQKLVEELFARELREIQKITKVLKAQQVPPKVVETFPKTCNSCGSEFHRADDFIDKTTIVSEKLTYFKDHVVQFRNCECGSTLTLKLRMERNTSHEGIRRREIFQSCLDRRPDIQLDIDLELLAEILRNFIREK